MEIMSPRVKFLVGFVATAVVAAGAFAVSRSALLSNLGNRTAGVMAANGIVDGRASWISDSGWTMRQASLSGTADAATRRRTIAAVSALDGVQSAVWVELPKSFAVTELTFLLTPAQCQQRIAAIIAAEPIGFDGETATMATEAETTVETIADVLNDCPRVKVLITSHVARADSPLKSLEVSERRAEAVIGALARLGINTLDYEPVGNVTDPDPGTEAEAMPKDRIEFAIRSASEG